MKNSYMKNNGEMVYVKNEDDLVSDIYNNYSQEMGIELNKVFEYIGELKNKTIEMQNDEIDSLYFDIEQLQGALRDIYDICEYVLDDDGNKQFMREQFEEIRHIANKW